MRYIRYVRSRDHGMTFERERPELSRIPSSGGKTLSGDYCRNSRLTLLIFLSEPNRTHPNIPFDRSGAPNRVSPLRRPWSTQQKSRPASKPHDLWFEGVGLGPSSPVQDRSSWPAISGFSDQSGTHDARGSGIELLATVLLQALWRLGLDRALLVQRRSKRSPV